MADSPDFERIRGYLQSQAAQKSIEDLISKVQEGVDELVAAARAIPVAEREAMPQRETWTPMDCLRHAASSNMHVAEQVLYVAHTGELPKPDQPPMPGTFEEPALPSTFEGIIARHAEAIDSLYAHVRDAAPDGFLHMRWNHPFFGDLNWREWLLFLRVHCKDHAGQLTAMQQAAV